MEVDYALSIRTAGSRYCSRSVSTARLSAGTRLANWLPLSLPSYARQHAFETVFSVSRVRILRPCCYRMHVKEAPKVGR